MALGVTQIMLVRHGQSEWNLSGRWQGQADPPLSELGRKQAHMAAATVGSVDAVWSSDLQRAAETASIIANEIGVGPVVIDEDLRERNAGEWQGLTRDEIHERYPGFLTPTEHDSPDAWKPRRPDGWESDASVGLRLHQALARIRSQIGYGAALVVSHAGLLYAAERELGANGSRLANLEGVRLDLDPDVGADQEVDVEAGQLSDIARLAGRIALLAPEQLTLPDEI